MKKYKASLLSFLLIGVFLATLPGGFTACAKEAEDKAQEKMTTDKKLILEVEFSSENQNEKKEEFEKIIHRNGKKYRLETVEYEVTDQKPVSIQKDVTKVVQSDPVKEGHTYVPEETIEENGIEYVLQDVKEKSGDTAVQTVNDYVEYDRPVSERDVPATKQVSAKNSLTGETMTVDCKLTGVEAITDNAWEDTYIDIVFESYDSNIFRWNGITVTKDTEFPLQGYEQQLLDSVGASEDSYRVVRTYWTGDPYMDANGIVCRNAKADVQKKISRYRANYSAEVQVGNGTVYEASYKGIETVTDPEQFQYTIRATATYIKDSSINPIFVGIGTALLILLVAAILFWIWKNKERKKERKEEVMHG